MENTAPTRVQSVTKSYHDAATIFGSHAVKLITVACIPAALSFFLSMALKVSIVASLTRVTKLSDIFLPEHISSAITLLLIITIVLVQTIGVIALIYTVVKHETVSIVDSFEHALGYFWRFIIVSLGAAVAGIIGLILGFIPVLVIGIIVALVSINALTATFDWITFIAPIVGAAISTYFIFAPYILIDKNSSIRSALRESPRLVRGHFWATAFRLLIYYSAAIVTGFALQYVPVAGPLLSLVLITPFTIVYVYTVYTHLVAMKQ